MTSRYIDPTLALALAPGLTLEQRRDALMSVCAAHSIRLAAWSKDAPSWLVRFSMFLPGFSRIVLSRRVLVIQGDQGSVRRVTSLGHELMHATRAAVLGVARWRLLYLLSPSFRQAEEMEADAYSIAMRAAILDARIQAPLIQAEIWASAEQWTGWRAPYYCGGSIDRGVQALEFRVYALLKGLNNETSV